MSLPLSRQDYACDPAEHVFAECAAKWTADRRARDAAKARIDNDPRIIARRAQKEALKQRRTPGGLGIFADMASGQQRAEVVLSRLIRARTELIEGFPHIARKYLREAVVIRRQSYRVVVADTDMVVLEQRTTTHTEQAA